MLVSGNMAWKLSILVVANVTAASDELFEALESQATQHPASFTLIVPATPFGGGRSAAAAKLEEAVGRLREAGMEAGGTVGAADPVVAVADAWDPKRYDEIVVSTLPMRFSKWLHAGLPERISKLTGAPVTHVVSRPTAPALASGAPPASAGAASTLGPLSVLGWGGHPARGPGS
jgi:GABA permease